MKLIRYQAPNSTPWPALDRWSNLRDELNSFFDMPFWSDVNRTGQLFTGWSPALDLYQSGDHFIAMIELPGMRKEDIEISLHDGALTISGERKREKSSNGETAQRTERYVGTFRRSKKQHVDVSPREDPLAHQRQRLYDGLRLDIPLVVAKAAIALMRMMFRRVRDVSMDFLLKVATQSIFCHRAP